MDINEEIQREIDSDKEAMIDDFNRMAPGLLRKPEGVIRTEMSRLYANHGFAPEDVADWIEEDVADLSSGSIREWKLKT